MPLASTRILPSLALDATLIMVGPLGVFTGIAVPAGAVPAIAVPAGVVPAADVPAAVGVPPVTGIALVAVADVEPDDVAAAVEAVVAALVPAAVAAVVAAVVPPVEAAGVSVTALVPAPEAEGVSVDEDEPPPAAPVGELVDVPAGAQAARISTRIANALIQ